MPQAIQIQQMGGPEVLSWTPIEVGDPGPGQVRLRQARINVNQRFALKDAADAHKALEALATSGSSILTI